MNHAFTPGERIAGRYEVIAALGAGGMGEVYEAHDQELDERVALKIIRGELASNALILQRFKREVQLARRVTHPNVCRIFDVAHHAGIAFVSMELLRGETLAEFLRRHGRMSAAQAMPIVEQMVEGLAAAHALGIVHRDFKSANVMIVPGVEKPRVVITDFGLAMELGSEERAPLTDPGTVIGTPDYMAPEQVEGLPVTPATDVYALGVVLFEMLTGRLPFTGTTPMAVALSRLRERPPSPRLSAPHLDVQWERVVLRCLEREPQRRYSDVRDVLRALRGDHFFAPLPPRRRAMTSLAVIGVLLVVAMLLALRAQTEKAAPQKTAAPLKQTAVAPRPSFAVLGFHNLSKDPASEWIGNAFAEMLTTELAAGESLRAVAGERVAQVKADHGLTSAEPIPAARMQAVRASLGCDLLVSGAFLALPSPNGRRVRLDVRVQDARSGAVRSTVSQSGSEGEMIDLIGRIGAQLRASLGSNASSADLKGLRASLPSNERVARDYAEGLARLRRLEAKSARPFFERAIAAEPNFPLAHAALAQTLWALGYERDARVVAKRALDLSTNLEREQRLDIEGRYHEYNQSWDRAIEIMRSLFTFYPDELTYGLRLAQVQANAGKGSDALATLAALRKLPPPHGLDPRIDLAEAEVAHTQGDYGRELIAAARARTKGMEQGARLIVARAEMNRGFAFRQTAKVDEALEALRAARELFEAGGDDAGVARATTNIALVLSDNGQLEPARKEYDVALAIHQRTGNLNARALTLVNVANLHAMRGDLATAVKTATEALTLATEVKNGRVLAHGRCTLGAYLQMQGNLDAAQRAYEEALVASRTFGVGTAELESLVNLAEVERLRGNFAASRAHTNAVIPLARQQKVLRVEAYALAGAAQLSLFEGKLDEALREQQAAIELYEEGKQASMASEARIGLANIALARGDAAMAEREATAAAEAFASSGAKDYEAQARLVRARALADRGKRDEASGEMTRIAAIAAKSGHEEVKIGLDTLRARLGNDRRLALRAAEQAKRAKLLPAEFEARLVAAEIRRAASRDEGNAELRAVAEEARRRGFALYRDRALKKIASV